MDDVTEKKNTIKSANKTYSGKPTRKGLFSQSTGRDKACRILFCFLDPHRQSSSSHFKFISKNDL